MPLKEIKPGLRGECYTVFSGTRIDKFGFEVMGIAHDFAGPGRDIIWCKMLTDPTGENVVAGGMSGSPCYIEGKHIGALAYGFTFNKDPIFGVQPIESMLELLHFQAPGLKAEPLPVASAPSLASRLLKTLAGFPKPMPLLSNDGGVHMLSVPLEIGGLHPWISQRVLSAWREAGFDPQVALGGGASETADTADFLPGAAMTGVIASGDLNLAATGTLTWRDGDQILGFGHPFLGIGDTSIPLGKAEIIGVVSSYERSIKMSNKGKIVGSLTQDRLSGVLGTVGMFARMTPMTVQVKHGAETRKFELQFCDNKFFTPLVYQTALLQFLSNVMERDEQSTLQLKSEIELEGLPSLIFEDMFAGERFSWVAEGVMMPALQLMPLYQNPFGQPIVKKINVEAVVQSEARMASLEDVSVHPLEARPGDKIQVRANFQPWQGKRFTRDFEIALPEEAKSGELELVVADERFADQLTGDVDGLMSQFQVVDLRQLVTVLNRRHTNNSLYLFLVKKSPGLSIQNQRLTSLPSSVRRLLNESPIDRPIPLQDSVLAEAVFDLGMVIEGNRTTKIVIK